MDTQALLHVAPANHNEKEEDKMEEKTIVTENKIAEKKKSRKGLLIFIAIAVILIITWIIVRPGIFTIQPIGALPDGITIIYHSRNPEMPFFSSPDGMCLSQTGGVSLMCRGIAISSSQELIERIILKLPYSQWAYLRSTGGSEFSN